MFLEEKAGASLAAPKLGKGRRRSDAAARRPCRNRHYWTLPRASSPCVSRSTKWPRICSCKRYVSEVSGSLVNMNSPNTLRNLHSHASPRYVVILVYVMLAALTWIAFGQILGHDFVAYDDQTYIYDNPRITAGVTVHGIVAAFTHPHARNWHPLTTISHMLDCQFFGLDPAGHHLINLLLHTAAVLLLFSILHGMTAALWRSAFVAAVFAIHPLRAESVAWIAERKDVLSGVFFMLTLATYVHYVRRPSVKRYLCMLWSSHLALCPSRYSSRCPCYCSYWTTGP